jgi:hypothetical protein
VDSVNLRDGTITDTKVATANKDGAAGTYSMRTLGTGAQQAAAGNDARIITTVNASSDVQVAGVSLPRGVPSGSNGYAQIVANAGGGSTTLTPITGLSITPTLDATRRYRLTFGGTLSSSAVGDRAIFGFVEGAANTAILQMQTGPFATSGSGYWYEGTIYLSGISGAKNYKAATMRGPSATGTISVLASAGVPAYIVIEDVGPA